MATSNPDTGVGATAALSTATFTASIVNVSELREQLEMVDTTHLGVASGSNMTKMAGDNPELQPITLTYQFKSEETPPRARDTTQDTLTITLPIASTSNTTAFSIQVAGVISENTLQPQLQRNNVNQGTLVFTPDGSSLTITAES